MKQSFIMSRPEATTSALTDVEWVKRIRSRYFWLLLFYTIPLQCIEWESLPANYLFMLIIFCTSRVSSSSIFMKLKFHSSPPMSISSHIFLHKNSLIVQKHLTDSFHGPHVCPLGEVYIKFNAYQHATVGSHKTPTCHQSDIDFDESRCRSSVQRQFLYHYFTWKTFLKQNF